MSAKNQRMQVVHLKLATQTGMQESKAGPMACDYMLKLLKCVCQSRPCIWRSLVFHNTMMCMEVCMATPNGIIVLSWTIGSRDAVFN